MTDSKSLFILPQGANIHALRGLRPAEIHF
jgi:hypothetical protein